jgi:molybdopterin-containing oxidoreductase family iron-sulfur binding subunit
MSRRAFLGIAAAGIGGVMLAPGIQLIEIARAATGTPSAGASAKVRWGMLIDTTKCATGCTDCVTACSTENGLAPVTATNAATTAQWIRKIEIKEVKTGRSASAPVMCQHCANRPRGRVPHRGQLQARRWHRAGRPSHLHRLPLLHDGLPLQGAFLRARTA